MKKRKNAKDKRRFLAWIPLGILINIALFSFLYCFMLSVVNFKPSRGLLGSVGVGFMNYSQLLNSASFGSEIGSALAQTVLIILITLPLGVLLSLALGAIRSRGLKAAFAGMALVLALVPDLYWVQCAVNAVGDVSSYWSVFVLSTLVPQTALCVFGGLCLNLAEGKNGTLGALLVGILPLFTLFTPDMRVNLLAGTPLNYGSSTTLSASIYRMGMMNMKYSYAAAAGVFGTVANLFVILLPVVLMCLIGKRKRGMAKEVRRSRVAEGWLAFAGALIAGLTMLFISLIGAEAGMGSEGAQALANTILLVFMAFIPAFCVCLVVVSCTRWCHGGVAVALLALLLMQMSVFNLSDYLITRNMGLMNTLLPSAFAVLLHPVFISVLAVLATSRPASGRQLMASSFGGAAVAAAISAGDWLCPMLTIARLDQSTMAAYVRSLMTTTEASVDAAMILLLGVCITLSAVAALLVMAGQKGSRMYKPEPVAEGQK